MKNLLRKLRKAMRKWIAEFRLRHGYCPQCNSSGPGMDSCPVCDGWWSGSAGNTYPPAPEVITRWRKRFFQARCVHGRPMDDRCPECQKDWNQMRSYIAPHGPRKG
jgi:hypothetical protein